MICFSRDAQCLVCFLFIYMSALFMFRTLYFVYTFELWFFVVILKYKMAPVWSTGIRIYVILLFVYFIIYYFINH